MNVHLPAPRRGWPARLVNLAVVIVVLALAAATFVLSYPGAHAIALQAGVSPRLARIYPGVFDAVLVIACAAAVTLRYARWWARCYAWLAIIVVGGVVGTADAVHAMNVALPHRQTEGVVAAAPWVLVLLGFSLMLTMLRQSRIQHAPAGTPSVPASTEPEEQPAASTVPEATTEEAEQEAAPEEEEEQTAALQYLAAPEPGWIERVADSGDPEVDSEDGQNSQDYWDRDDAFRAVPHLNRVRATPIPPEEDDE